MQAVINDSDDPTHRWLVGTVGKFAQKAGIGMPEVALYEGDPNAFATGAFKNSALVAVSTGLLQNMTKDEVEAVIARDLDQARGQGHRVRGILQRRMARHSLHLRGLCPHARKQECSAFFPVS